jgi:hypothetical protein
MQKNKPSIYQDRGTIGSAKELDEYGVWVKSEPQILDSGGAETDSDVSLPDLDDLPNFSVDLDSSSGPGGEDFSIPEDDFNLDDFDTGLEGTDEVLAGFPGDDGSGSLGEDGMSFPDDGEAGPAEQDGETGSSQDISAQASEEPASGDDGDFVNISLEDLLGGLEDEAPGEQNTAEEPEQDPVEEAGQSLVEEPEQNPAGEAGQDMAGEAEQDAGPVSTGMDMSTQLLMKIAGELSSIRQELSALKQEFSMSRGGFETESGESRGFFDNAGGDDKIALTGDELNNIINTADFTEETGADATGDTLGFSGGDGLDTLEAGSPGAGVLNTDTGVPEGDLPGGAPLGEALAGEALLPEIPEDLTEEQPPTEVRGEAEEGFSLVEESGEDELELPEISLDETEDLLALNPETITEGETDAESAFPDISLELPPDGEEIGIGDFEEGALDLSDAVIDEPDLGVEIQENPPLEPVLEDIAVFEESPGVLEGIPDGAPGDDADLLSEVEGIPHELGVEDVLEEPLLELLEEPLLGNLEEPLLESLEEPLLESLEEPAVEIIEDEKEIARAEESAAEIPSPGAGGSRGEDLEQIIPEGFLVEEIDDEGEAGFGGAGLDTLDEGVSLDEIPEDISPEEEGQAEDAAEPETAGLPGNFRKELKQVLSYMDQLLESLPEEKIEEFAQSEYFDTYKKLFKELGLT